MKRGQRADGTLGEKGTKGWGYQRHLLVDSLYELPWSWKLTRASGSDPTEWIPWVKDRKQRRSDRIERAQDRRVDRDYDSTQHHAWRWEECGIQPLIEIRWMGKEPETRLPADHGVDDEKGPGDCFCPRTVEPRKLAYQGFEQECTSLKYHGPAAADGFEWQGCSDCGPGHCSESGRVVRIPGE